MKMIPLLLTATLSWGPTGAPPSAVSVEGEDRAASVQTPQAAQVDTVQAPSAPPGEFAEGDFASDERMTEALELQRSIQQLFSIYRRMDGLRNVQVHLEAGILELSGSALSTADRVRAGELAEALTGVVYVDNRIRVEASVGGRVSPALERLQEKGLEFLRFLPILLVALLIVAGAIALAGWAGRRGFPYTTITDNPFAQNVLRQVVRFVVFLFGALLALDLLGIAALVGALLGTAGVMGLAIGFAFRDIVENYLAGIILSLRQPFAPQDEIEIAGNTGRVARLTGRETILMTRDGNHVRLPNALVFKSVMVNFTRNPRRRFVVDVGIAPLEDVTHALRTGEAAIRSVPGIMDTPPVASRIRELGASTVELRFSGWVDQIAVDFDKARSEAIRVLKEAFEREEIETPSPEYGIRVLKRSGVRKVAAPSPPEPSPDMAPDVTIEEEIEKELAQSDEENLLKPPASPA